MRQAVSERLGRHYRGTRSVLKLLPGIDQAFCLAVFTEV